MYDLLYCIDYVVPNKIHSFIHSSTNGNALCSGKHPNYAKITGKLYVSDVEKTLTLIIVMIIKIKDDFSKI